MKDSKHIFKWIQVFIQDSKWSYLASIILAVVKVIAGIIPYYLLGVMIKNLLEKNREWTFYAPLLFALMICWCVYQLSSIASSAISHCATFRVLANIRRQVLQKLGRLPLGEVLVRSSGSYKNVIVERIAGMEVTLAHIIPEATSALLGSALVCIYLLVIDWRLALASLVTLPLGMVFFGHMIAVSNRGHYGEKTIETTKILNNTVVEYINGIDVIKVFGKSKSSYAKFVTAAENNANSFINWMARCIVDQSLAMNILPATLVIILPFGAWLVMKGSLVPEDYILSLVVSLGFIPPLITVASYMDDMSKIGVVFGEVVDILEKSDLQRPFLATQIPTSNEVMLKNVHFAYQEGMEILHGIDLVIKAGSVNALVGPSGSGKSTVAKLIASFWDPTQGDVFFGGVNIKDLPYNDYIKQISYVAQDNYLFNDTVMENIRMGKADATDEEVICAAKNCGCHEFIMGLADGYQTIVGASGGHLSGGERQRIAIARAMLKDAPLVILDEATAYTDPENEAFVQRSLAKLIQGKTLLVIAHRLSTIANADQIIVMNQGRIEAVGTQTELLTHSDLYRNMWESHIATKDIQEGGEVHA